jgi:hypothetical protein
MIATLIVLVLFATVVLIPACAAAGRADRALERARKKN